MNRTTAKLIIAAKLCVILPAQSFDVASVKLNTTNGPADSNFPLGPGDAYTPNGGRFWATGFPLALYIAFAYKLNGGQGQALNQQLPAWALSDRYDIEARAAGNPTKDEMRQLMRALLADRFKLAVHTESRETPVAAVVLAKEGKLGAQLRRHPEGEPCPTTGVPPGASIEGGFPTLCGGLLGLTPSVPGRFRTGGRNITMVFIATALSGVTNNGRPLVDGTGLDGRFDFVLEWSPEITGPLTPSIADRIDATGPTFEQALRDQLGLKLEARKAPISRLILDHVERPSEN